MSTPIPGRSSGGAAGHRTGPAATAATQAVLDAIRGSQLDAGQLEDCGFWPAKAADRPGPDAAAARADPGRDVWAGRGFTRPGPGAEAAPGLYRAALEDALAYTTDRDGCGDCDRDRLCDTHTTRTARAAAYQAALDQELEASS